MANEFIARNGIISKSNLIVSGSLTALSTITAQTLVVQTITSSISSITGSTNFGSLSSNTHTFTGSINASGSLTGTSATFSGNVRINAPTNGTNKLIFGILATDYYWIEYNDATGNIGYSSKYNHIFYGGGSGTTQILSLANNGAAAFSSSVNVQNFLTVSAASTLLAPASGKSIEMVYRTDGANDYGFIQAYDRTASVFKRLDFNAAMTILGSGNVGIGRTDPSYALDVWSSIRASSNNTFSPSLYLNYNNTNVVRFLADQNSAYIITQNAYPVEIQTNNASKALFGSGAISDVSFFTYSGYKQYFSGGDQMNFYLNNAGTIMYLNYQGNGGIRAGTSQQVLYAGSDIRIKKDISLIDSTLNKVLALSPKIFKYKEGLDIPYYGFIAQDMEEVFPELVRTDSGTTMCNDEEIVNQKSIESYGLVWASILTKAIQELTARVQYLENK
jgi:hypothetical protein